MAQVEVILLNVISPKRFLKYLLKTVVHLLFSNSTLYVVVSISVKNLFHLGHV